MSLFDFSLTFSFFFVACSYFVYHRSVDAIMGTLLFWILASLTSVLSLIPFGTIIQFIVLFFIIKPLVFKFTGLSPTWLTTGIIVLPLAFGSIYCLRNTRRFLIEIKKL
ncbi:MAG: hypothetical protein QXI58_00675 [Candidatus Micrarchaeia archaeon]